MARKRTTPPPDMTVQEVATRHYEAFWGTRGPIVEEKECVHRGAFPWPLHCPAEGCDEQCRYTEGSES